MGLTTCWGDSLEKLEKTAWSRFGGSIAQAEVASSFSYAGERALHIRNGNITGDSPAESGGSYAELSQRIPVVANQAYELRVWVLSQDCQPDAVQFLADNQPILSVPSGSYGWQQLALSFQPKANEVSIRIRCRGVADVWIDELRIVRKPATE